MELSLLTWNSININDGSVFRASIPPGGMANFRTNPISVPRANDFPQLSRTMLPAHTFTILVDVLPGNTIGTKREILKGYFNPRDQTRHNLVAKDTNDSDKQWYLTGYPISFSPQNGTKISWVVVLAVETPEWRLVTAGTNTWNITASGQTNAVSNVGNVNVAPSFAITPTSTKSGGLKYRRWVPIYNNLDVSFKAPFDVSMYATTSGGFDTATLTTTKMQADGDDLRLWMDGAETERWLNGMDTATTQIWMNLNLSPRKEAILVTSLATTAAFTEIELEHTRASKTFLNAMAKATNKIVLIGSEALSFTGANDVTYKLTGVLAAQKDTTAADHAAGVTVRWIEHDLWILYGDSTLGAPDVDDDNKPIFSLASTNSTWSYTNFFATTTPRPGAWSGGVSASKTELSYAFTGDSNDFADPSTELGLALVGSQSAYNMISETGTIAWALSHPAGITSVTYSGSKYAVNSFPAVCGLQYLQTNTAWFTAENQAAPAVVLAWEDFGPSTASISSPYPTSIRFALDGSLSPATGEIALAQFDTVSVTFDSTKLPTASIGAEVAVYWFDFTLTNNTSTEYIKVKTPCLLNTALTIDCENKQAYLADGARVSVVRSTNRDAWLDLRSGSNQLQFDDVGTAGVTVVTSHRDRTI